MNYVILDLEATCWDGWDKSQNETIEIGAVLINDEFEMERDDYILCSWGFYDQKQFESDCVLHGLDIHWLEKHISLKHQYRDIKKLKRALGMKRALEKENLKLEGTTASWY